MVVTLRSNGSLVKFSSREEDNIYEFENENVEREKNFYSSRCSRCGYESVDCVCDEISNDS